MLTVKIKRALPGFKLDVEFAIDKEILAVLGPSGSGKTMTLMCIAGLVKPDEGFISLNNKVLFDSDHGINLSPKERGIGFVFQQYALFPHMTVEENVAYGINHLDKKKIKEKVAALLDSVHVQGLGKRLPRQLSSGQQQRVALARALAPEPELLLLDEPFSALDTIRKERLEMELLAIQQSYKGNMLFVTHDLAQGFKLSSRMAIFDSGKIIQFGEKDRVINAPVNRIAAGLAGVKNLIPGVISEVRVNDVSVDVPGLGKTLRAKLQNGLKLTVGQHVTIGIRPECIQLNENGVENSVSLIVDRVVTGVAFTECRLLADSNSDFRLRASFFRTQCERLAVGDNCKVYLPPEHITIIIE
jgi:molybdate transport system ATP-binding protein